MTVRDILRCEPCRVLVHVEAVEYEWPHRTLSGRCGKCGRDVSDRRLEADHRPNVPIRFLGIVSIDGAAHG